MKALSAQQPWPWAIGAGFKTVENRGRGTSHRGEIAIHSGKRRSARPLPTLAAEQAFAELGGLDACWDANGFYVLDGQIVSAQFDEFPRSPLIAMGAVIAVADLVDCHPSTGCCAPWGEDRHERRPGMWAPVTHLVLENVRTLSKPVPCRGQLWVPFTLPDDVITKVRRQLDHRLPPAPRIDPSRSPTETPSRNRGGHHA